MKKLPRLDTHSHISPDLGASDALSLDAFILAMTRSLAEYESTRRRNDKNIIWGVGTHPGLVKTTNQFDPVKFEAAIMSTPLVGEIGLDGSSRVPLSAQSAILRSTFQVLQKYPRITSLHSSGAHIQLLRELHRTPIDGVVLHWWTSSPELTEEAVRIGCYFSLPPAMLSSVDTIKMIPIRRLLPETDHPYGDRRTPGHKQPGNVSEVEHKLAKVHDMTIQGMRLVLWSNLNDLVNKLNLSSMFGVEWRSIFRQVEDSVRSKNP